ncbi:MAG TPA: DUF3306 domain-containing protein [Usitatibacter sp.]|nr:DUF3306 domain-containing protein [Usitatibacter sp.]
MSDDNFLSRWSRRKIASRAGAGRPTEDAAPMPMGTPSPAPTRTASPVPAEEQPPQPLPPLESLTPESDFSPFMKAEVDPATRRQALKTLFEDPRFNVMDGLDVYIDDYSKPDPLPEGWLEKMNQVARLGDFRPKEPDGEPEPAAAVPADQLVQKDAGEQPLAPVPDANSSDTPINDEPPPESGKTA